MYLWLFVNGIILDLLQILGINLQLISVEYDDDNDDRDNDDHEASVLMEFICWGDIAVSSACIRNTVNYIFGSCKAPESIVSFVCLWNRLLRRLEEEEQEQEEDKARPSANICA